MEARHNETDSLYEWWLSGFLSAMNLALADTYNLVGFDDLHGPMLWLENWCTQNPQKTIQDGAAALVRDLYPRRQKTAPK